MTPILQRSLELLEARSDAQRKAIFARMRGKKRGLPGKNVSSSFRGTKLYHGDKSDDRKKVIKALSGLGRGTEGMRLQAYSTSALKKMVSERRKAIAEKAAKAGRKRGSEFVDNKQMTGLGTGRINPKYRF